MSTHAPVGSAQHVTETVTAGLRSTKDADRGHLVLTLERRDPLPSAR